MNRFLGHRWKIRTGLFGQQHEDSPTVTSAMSQSCMRTINAVRITTKTYTCLGRNGNGIGHLGSVERWYSSCLSHITSRVADDTVFIGADT